MREYIKDIMVISKDMFSEKEMEIYQKLYQMSIEELWKVFKSPSLESKEFARLCQKIFRLGDLSTHLKSEEKRKILEYYYLRRNDTNWSRFMEIYEVGKRNLLLELENHPLVIQEQLLDEMKKLSINQDENLKALIDSIPISSVMYLSSDSQREELTRLYHKVVQYKNEERKKIFDDEIIFYLKNHREDYQFSKWMKMLSEYVYYHRLIDSGVDSRIQAIYTNASLEAIHVQGEAKVSYLSSTYQMFDLYHLYDENLKKVEQFTKFYTKK